MRCVCVLWFEFVCFGAQRCVMFDQCLVIPTVIDTSMWVVDGDDGDECERANVRGVMYCVWLRA